LSDPGPWWRELDRYMWWVLVVSALGWVFDVMDQRIFTSSRPGAMDELLSVRVDRAALERLTAGEAARLIGLDPPLDPAAPVAVDPPLPQAGDGGGAAGLARRPELVIPGAAGTRQDPKPRRLTMVVSPDLADVRILPPPERNHYIGRIATAVFLVGWATGGLLFGILGDKWGRAFTMVLTILIYSVFTGLSALSVSWIDYSAYRFLTGMGVGGEFAAGAALVAEVMPARARPYALGLLQALSAVGNIIGSLIARWVLPAENAVHEWEDWRLLYLVGVVPALLIVVIRGRLREPDRWRAVKESTGGLIGKELGAFKDLFVHPWLRSTLAGMTFAAAGVLGLWGIGFWTPELIGEIVGAEKRSQISPTAFALQDVGAFFGISAITLLSQGAPRGRIKTYAAGLAITLALDFALVVLGAGTVQQPGLTASLGASLAVTLYFLFALLGSLTGGIGRRASFALAFIASFVAIYAVFRHMQAEGQIYWAVPVLGFATLLPFGLYAIYFPELYPTRLRTTGTGFCYNVARYVAAGGLFVLADLGRVFTFRESAVLFSTIYIVGLLAVAFAPETKDRPLAED
jgi:MFS family permease